MGTVSRSGWDPVRSPLSRWFLPGLAVGFAVLTLLFVGFDADDPLRVALLEGTFPVVLSGILFVVGYRYFATTDLPETETRTVALWTLAGVSFIVGLYAGFRILGLVIGDVEFRFVAVTILAAGTVGGAVVGISIARARCHRTERRQALADYRELFEKAEDGIFIDDPETGTVLDVNQRGAEMLGYTPDELEGRPIGAFSADVPEFSQDQSMETMQRALEGDPQRFDWLVERKDGSHLWVEVSLKRTSIGGETRLIALLRDISERKRREQQFRALQQATLELADTATAAEVAETTVDIVHRALDRELAGLWRYDTVADRLELAAATATSRTLLVEAGYDPEDVTIERGDVGMEVFEAGDLHVIEDYAEVDNPAIPEVDLGTVILAPVGDYGLLELSDRAVSEVTETDRYLADILARNAETAFDRVERERRLEQLHEFTREMVQATDEHAVCELTVEATWEVLGLPVNTVWCHEEDPDGDERLRPIASTEQATALLGDIPTFTPDDESLSWEVFETGEATLFDDLHEHPERYNPDTPIRSEIIVPVGDHGVLNAGATEPNVFSEADLTLVSLLTANAAAALNRVEREALLQTRTDELTQLTSQMEFFNSILRHDVLNGMTVIRGRGQMLAEDLDGPRRQHAETIVRWADDLTEMIDRVRSILETLTEPDAQTFEPVDLAALVRTELDRVEQTYPEVTVERDIPDRVPVRADELLADVVGNIVRNAVSHNDPEGLRISVSVEPGDPVRVRIADSGTGIPDEQKDAVFRRGETGHAKATGSGFGLFFVESMVTAYDGDVRVEDADCGGAAFLIELPRAEPGGKLT